MEQFIKLYESVYRDLYRFACYYLGNTQDAEDAVSEAVLKAYESFHQLRKPEAFRSWIFTILVNQCKKVLVKRSARGTMELLEEPSYTPKMCDSVITGELMASLSEEERQIISLVVFGGYKGAEIARIMNCKHSTIRSRYRRALKKLEKQILEQEVRHEK
ncbi:MAG: RNA polymerase sigma factor [Lachnospiraceae bacterium]|nr:RNA polymerase sigma factor [Lachnospiraceae bacterium]